MRVLLALLLALPATAQFLEVTLLYRGTGCDSCAASLDARMSRVRGVASVTHDAGRESLALKLEADNRVRLEQLWDRVAQDGTKLRQAQVTAVGTVEREGDRFLFRLPATSATYRLHFESLQERGTFYPEPEARYRVEGAIEEIRPAEGPAILVVERIAIAKDPSTN
jgi:hypothetical protein